MQLGIESEATIVFTAMAGFTAASAKQTPTQVAVSLNEHFLALGDQLYAHGGQIIKFMGDAVLAAFLPAPDRDHHALRAVQAVLAAQEDVVQPFTAGVHSGVVYMGPIGHPRHATTTDVVGDTVNLAMRALQTAGARTFALERGIVITAATYTQCQHAIECQQLGTLPVKGLMEPVVFYRALRTR